MIIATELYPKNIGNEKVENSNPIMKLIMQPNIAMTIPAFDPKLNVDMTIPNVKNSNSIGSLMNSLYVVINLFSKINIVTIIATLICLEIIKKSIVAMNARPYIKYL